ncbi:MAG: iron-sulfur cluster assembly scaffold protein [Betaproteobacteria bacterium]|nr:MAG: iron-sulfur cluster assembly scaffold protein [Betaproteobacteria bacterium]
MTGASQIYHEAIKALASAAIGDGSLTDPSGTAFLDNPLCGDCVEMRVKIAEGTITALSHRVRGCLLCQAAASLLGKRAAGSTRQDIERIAGQVSQLLRDDATAAAAWEEIAVFKPVHGHTSRYRCVELPFQALITAMQDAEARD